MDADDAKLVFLSNLGEGLCPIVDDDDDIGRLLMSRSSYQIINSIIFFPVSFDLLAV